MYYFILSILDYITLTRFQPSASAARRRCELRLKHFKYTDN